MHTSSNSKYNQIWMDNQKNCYTILLLEHNDHNQQGRKHINTSSNITAVIT